MVEMHSDFVRARELEEESRYIEAIQAYDRAIADDPDEVSARWNRALLYMLLGDFKRGLPEYEYRWNDPTELAERPLIQDLPQWQGEPLGDRRLLLWNEQGLGDIVMMSRYLPLLFERQGHRRKGWNFDFIVPKAVERFLQSVIVPFGGSIPAENFLTVDQLDLPLYGCHSPIMSFPYAFGTTPETIPTLPHIRIPKEEFSLLTWRWPRIGVAWRGSASHSHDARRSIPLKQFRKITDDLQLTAISLQHELNPEDFAEHLNSPAMSLLKYTDLLDVAKIIQHCELVITVDTAVAHLAGTMAKPVWILVQYDPDWRWGLVRRDSPWYPTARLYRQRCHDYWGDVIEEVRADLQKLILQKSIVQ